MKYDKLKRYEKLVIEERIMMKKDEEVLASAESFTDTVQGSHKEFPYTKGTVKITGMRPEEEERVKTERAVIAQRLRRIRGEMKRVEEYIGSIQDPVVQALLEYHILNGFTWRDSASKVFGFGRVHENTARMIVMRWLRKHK